MKIRNIAALNREDGFTFVELIVILVIISIMTFSIAINFNDSNSGIKCEFVIKKIAADVRYARQMALAKGTGTRVYIDASNNQYYLKWSNGNYIQNPETGADFIIQLGDGGFQSIEITGTEFLNGRLDFSTQGNPSNSGANFSGELNLVTLNSKKALRVVANTGFLKIADI